MNRLNRVLLPLFLGLFSLAWFLEEPWKGDAFERTALEVGPLFPELVAQRAQISKVILMRDQEQTTLERGQAGFGVAERMHHPAANQRLVHLIDALSLLDDRDVVSTNPDKFLAYGLAEHQGTRIQVYAGDKLLADAHCGSMRQQDPQMGGKMSLDFYLRAMGGQRVVLARGFTPPMTGPGDWLEAPLVGVEESEVVAAQRIDVRTGNEWHVQKTGEDWSMTKPVQEPLAELYTIDSFLFSMCRLYAEDVFAEAKDGLPEEFGPLEDLFQVASQEGNLFEVHLGKLRPGGLREAWIPGAPWLYGVAEHDVHQLRQTAETMLRSEPPGDD